MDIKNDGKLDKVEETLYSAEKTTQVIKPPVAISMGNYEYIKEKHPDLLDEYDFCVYLSILDLERMGGVNGQT